MALLVATMFFASTAHAQFEGPTRILNSNAATDMGNDGELSVAGDGSGTWLALFDVSLLTRSTDNGNTWSAFTFFPGSNSVNIGTVAASTAGTWLIATDKIYRSTDGGVTWSAGVDVGTFEGSFATDGAGTWMFVGIARPDVALYGNDNDIFASVSTDDGITWSPLLLVVNDNFNESFPDIATDGNGRWVVIWSVNDIAVNAAASSDLGASWTAPQFLAGARPIAHHRIAYGQGRWIVVPDAGPNLGYFVSDDGGVTWGPPQLFEGSLSKISPFDNGDPVVATDGKGTWHIGYWSEDPHGRLGTESDIVVITSTDNGDTWSKPAAASERALGRESALTTASRNPALAYDGVGSWILGWQTTDTFDGTIGTDFDLAYVRWSDDCPAVPSSTCVATPRRSKLSIRSLDTVRDSLVWKWSSNVALDPATLADPTVQTSYVLCVYDDQGGNVQLVHELDARAAVQCKGSPCWRSMGSGFRYRDSGFEQGGIKTLLLKSSPRGKIKVRGSGLRLAPPRLPLTQTTSVTVELINLQTSDCWQAISSTNKKNTTDVFKARSD